MKDAKGHGSNKRSGLDPVAARLQLAARNAIAAKTSYSPNADGRLNGPLVSNAAAAAALASGPKSAPAPVHDAMSYPKSTRPLANVDPNSSTTSRNSLPHWPQPGEPGGRPVGYKPPGDFRTRDPSGRLTRQRRK